MAKLNAAVTPAHCTAGTTATGSVRGTIDVPAPAWLPNGCPTWCEVGDLHRDGDRYNDRNHMNLGAHVTLSLADAPVDEPATFDVAMQQHYRETEPRVWIGRDGSSNGEYLTIAEAREFAMRVLQLTKLASDESEKETDPR